MGIVESVVVSFVVSHIENNAMQTFRIAGGIGFCNALRRTLLSDIETEAPCRVMVECNTTCFTDEFIAHRIGLIPFKRVGNGDCMHLHATGPVSAMSSSLTGPSFVSVHDVEIARVAGGGELRLSIFFDRQPASKHARYSPCAAVGMSIAANGTCAIRFSSNDTRPPKELMLCALDHMDARIGRALHALANQNEITPKSYT